MHPWEVTPEEAIAIQKQMRPLVQGTNSFTMADIKTVAGIDASYKDYGRAAIVVLSFPGLEVIEQVTARQESVFPYVPGLLSFREGPVVLTALTKLTIQPDLLIFDGQGYAHPRRLGLASHMGVYLDRPAIGCAKSRLIGTFTAPGPNIGDWSPLTDRGEIIGAVLRSKPKTNPLFISPGHKIDLETAIAIILQCLRGFRLPEPTRLADKLAGIEPASETGE